MKKWELSGPELWIWGLRPNRNLKKENKKGSVNHSEPS